MVGLILPTAISESYRLSGSGMHQGIVVALQLEFDGLRIKSPGVLLEISRVALLAASVAKDNQTQKIVLPVRSSFKTDTYYPYRKP